MSQDHSATTLKKECYCNIGLFGQPLTAPALVELGKHHIVSNGKTEAEEPEPSIFVPFNCKIKGQCQRLLVYST